jgi:(p)ppGpp synthase/HD superfamily hydrolase
MPGSPPDLDLEALARAVAASTHAGQTDKAGHPYIAHPARVAARLSSYGPHFRVVAWLHDVLEDSEITAVDLADMGFPPEVVEGVVSVTRLDGESHRDAVTRAAGNPYGLVVKAADVADNSDAARLAELPEETRARLVAKYRQAREILEASGAPTFRREEMLPAPAEDESGRA